MGLRYYRDLLHDAVTHMACSSGKFSDRLLIAWSGCIYKFDWDDFEEILMEEDLPAFHNLKKRMLDDLLDDIEKRRRLISEQTCNALRPLTNDQISEYANAKSAIRSMPGSRAKKAVGAIIEMYSAVVLAVDHQDLVSAKGQTGGL